MAGYVHSTYGNYIAGSAASADAVAAELMARLAPRSVIDVGCGAGVWLDAFRRHGAQSVLGVDGPWAPAKDSLPQGRFVSLDFERADPALIAAEPAERADLVISLEFLEHVRADRADLLVDFLCARGDALLVSAAIPLQGGQHHVNEQWPEYWIDRFRARGFVPFDVLRHALWNDDRIAPWYRQNMLLFFRGEVPPAIREWGEQLALQALDRPSARVHPEFYARRLGRLLYALESPLGFLRLLLQERRDGQRRIPPMPGLHRPAA